MKTKKAKLAWKMILGCIILGILIASSNSLIGYRHYKSNLEKLYNDTAYEIAEVTHSYFSDELLNEYVNIAVGYNNGTVSEDTLKEYMSNPEYTEIIEKVKELRYNMEANDIFFVYVDQDILQSYSENMTEEELNNWRPVVYILDSYIEDDLCFYLGDKGKFNPSYVEDTVTMFQTGERTDNYFISESEFGYNTSAMLPIVYNGKTIAAIGVEMPMKTLTENLRQYIISSIVTSLLIELAFIALYMAYIYRNVVKPVNNMSNAASDFTKNGNKISETLDKIKTGDEIENLAYNIKKMETDINDYIENITSITAERERIGAELDVATHIQSSMLPCVFPTPPENRHFDIYASMTPAKEVGGDFYDFFSIDDKHLAIVMADVSGKGVPAALFMVIGKTLLKDHTTAEKDLGEVFTEVNNILCESNSEGLFITAFEGVINLETGEMNYVNAGHEMPFICHKDGSFEAIKIRPGFVLAGMDGMKYHAGTIQLQPGDKVFQYTDGVTEATNADNKLYGMDRLTRALNQNKDKSPRELLPAIKEDIDIFVGDAPQFDDITMLCVDYHPQKND